MPPERARPLGGPPTGKLELDRLAVVHQRWPAGIALRTIRVGDHDAFHFDLQRVPRYLGQVAEHFGGRAHGRTLFGCGLLLPLGGFDDRRSWAISRSPR